MTFVSELKEELAKGFTKSQLETIIGLPKNNLSGMMANNRNFSRKSIIKLKAYFANENRPGPYDLPAQKIEENGSLASVITEVLEVAKQSVKEEPIIETSEGVKMDYNQILKLAKDGGTKEEIGKAIANNGKLNARQVEMIYSKITQK